MATNPEPSTGLPDPRAALSDAKDVVQDAAESDQVGWLARAGLTARGVVYLLMGVLALLLSQGSSSKHVDQKGALAEVLSHTFGGVLVGALAVGFLAYALWRLAEAAVGVTGEGRMVSARLKSAARGIAYLGLTFTAVSALRGSAQTQASQQTSWTARSMTFTGGRVLVALVGLLVIAVGAAMVVEGVRLKFMRYFTAVPPSVHDLIVHLGRIGTVGRGLVFMVIGGLFVSAAWTLDPHQAGGMDVAFRTLLQQPFGRTLAIAAALALMAFGVYGLAEARYRRV